VALDAADPCDEHEAVIRLGLVVTPALDSGAVAKLAEEVERELAERYRDVGWSVTAVRDQLVTAPTPSPKSSTLLVHACSTSGGTWSFT
jgi:hypothetical protein